MRIAFRADASAALGSGHLMRCLSLADHAARHGAACVFLCGEAIGPLAGLVRGHGHELCVLPAEEDWQSDAAATQRAMGRPAEVLVVDHYRLDARWEIEMAPFARLVLCIDDLANRPHRCQLLLDQNYYADSAGRYGGLVPESCTLLLGPRFAMLRDEFDVARRSLPPRIGDVRRVLVFFGGSDPTAETDKALDAISLLGWTDVAFDVVVGAANPRAEALRLRCAAMPNVAFHCQVGNMAELMCAADLALGAGGSAILERLYLGLPSLVVIVADNQQETTRAVAGAGGLILLGEHAEASAADMAAAMSGARGDADRLRRIAATGFAMMPADGIRGTEAVYQQMRAKLR